MRMLKIILCFFIMILLVACSNSEFMNLYAFTENYNKVSENKLSLESFTFQNPQNPSYTAVLGSSDNQVLLCLKSEKSDIIEEVDLSIIKNKNQKPKSIQTEFFIEILTNILKAYCGYGDDTAKEIIASFGLDNYEAYIKEGELTLKRDNFYFVYYSTEIISQVRIYNTYLREIEVTEKPVSKPYYADDFIIKETP